MRYRSLFHFLMSPLGRSAFFKAALTAYLILGLVAATMILSWTIAKYNSWLDSRAEECLQRLIPECGFTVDFNYYYRCALRTELRSSAGVSKQVYPMLKAHGQSEDFVLRICSSVLRLTSGERYLDIERRFTLLENIVSAEHGFVALLAIAAMFAIFIFGKWLRWVFS